MATIKRSFKRMLIVLLILYIPVNTGCRGELQCIGGINDTEIDTNGSSCQEDCECNNQNFEGICLNKVCSSVVRAACLTIGITEKCYPRTSTTGNTCKEGIRICKDNGLQVMRWGDCKCPTDKEHPKERPAKEDEQDNRSEQLHDAGTPEKMSSPEIQSDNLPSDTTSPPCTPGKAFCQDSNRIKKCGTDRKWHESRCKSRHHCLYDKCKLVVSYPGLIGYWAFDNKSGRVAEDLSGKKHNGQILTDVKQAQPGVLHSAFEFIGNANSGIILPNALARQTFSFCAWIFPKNTSNDLTTIFTMKSDEKTVFSVQYNVQEKQIEAYVKYKSEKKKWSLATKANAAPVDTWKMLCVTQTIFDVFLYVDGQQVKKGSNGSAYLTKFGKITQTSIGKSHGKGTSSFVGRIDEVMFYEDALLDSEILALYKAYPKKS